MARSKYRNLNRVIREVQEVCGVDPQDGLIGPNTERHLAEVLDDYDGNDVLGYLSELVHKQVEKSPALPFLIHDSDPHHLKVAKGYIGVEEIKGAKHNPTILKFWERCHLPFKTDETAWCAGFVGGVLEECGIRSTRSGMARSYLNWGVSCMDDPQPGCVVVFWRGHIDSPYGHVAFLANKLTSKIRVPALGGNQGDQVCIKGYPRARVLDFRKPA